jgi:hypothetical protein
MTLNPPSLHRSVSEPLTFVHVLSRTATAVRFSTAGGGPILKATPAAFDSAYLPAPPPSFQAMQVAAEWLDGGQCFAAYSNGIRWNGWEKPFFELSEGLRLCGALGGSLTYNAARDAFVSLNADAPEGEQEETFPAELVEVGGAVRKLYGIGAGSWTWDAAG